MTQNKHGYVKKSFVIMLIMTMLVSMFQMQSFAFDVDYTLSPSELPSLDLSSPPEGTEGASLTSDSTDPEKDVISMSEARHFEAEIPVSMTVPQAQKLIDSDDFYWNLTRKTPYLSTELYPNYYKGTALADWINSDEEPLFDNIETSVIQKAGRVYIKVTFDCGLYFADGSFPHSNTVYMDYIGWYELSAVSGNLVRGSVAAKVLPYDNFHTMGEVYEAIDALAASDSDHYIERFSMGKSEKGYDMPYLIIAKDEKAVDNWLALTKRAEEDPNGVLVDLANGDLGDYQVPVMFSNIHSNEVSAVDGILQFADMLTQNDTLSYDVLADFTEEGRAQLAEEMGTPGEEGSLAIPELVKDKSTFLGYLKAGNAVSGQVDLDKYYTKEEESISVDQLLDDVFFILVPEENVEGRIYMTRQSSGGLDLNRDNSFQTQNETQNMQQLIGKYNPVSLTELHGRVQLFQCEPCDPPHEPNFEYDLLADHLMTGGEAFGIAAVANNEGYNSYVIPQRDYLEYTGKQTADGQDETYWADPWDDMSTSYTPQFAMLQGTVGYTVELPAYNDATAKAAAYGQLGQSVYIADNKDSYLQSQVKIYARGLANANSNDYDLVGQWFTNQYDVEGAEADLFRPEYDGQGENGNFYPEAYLIPLDGTHQSNLQAAADMMTWLTRNDVVVNLTTKAYTYKGVTYPKGTLVVPMYQAKRSVANGALYDGTLIEDWTVLYSEGITTFNETRGFDMVTMTEPASYESLKAVLGSNMDYLETGYYLDTLSSAFTGQVGGQVIISNASEDSTAAVNQLLDQGYKVGFITEGDYAGDYMTSYEAWESLGKDFLLTGTGLTSDYPSAQVISKRPTVYIAGRPSDTTAGYIGANFTSAYSYNYDRQALDLMNFTTTTDLAKADIIVSGSSLSDADLAAVKAGTPLIAYGSNYGRGGATSAITLFDDVERMSIRGSLDALAYVVYPEENLVNASYVKDGDDVMYGYGAGFFASVPEGAETIVKIDGTKEPTEGFLRSTDPENLKAFLDGSIQAFTYEGLDKDGNTVDVAVFANSLTHKVHQRDDYGFISNFIFSNTLGGAYLPQ